jgi:hypothetical protein
MMDEVIDAEFEDDGEQPTVDGLPVVADLTPIDRGAPAVLPTVQAAAAAATGFVAGAAMIALIRRHSARKLTRGQLRLPDSRRRIEMLPVVASRTFLVDVHVIAKPGE